MYVHGNLKNPGGAVPNALAVLALVATGLAVSHWSVPLNSPPLLPARYGVAMAPSTQLRKDQSRMLARPDPYALYRFMDAPRVSGGSFSQVMRRDVERVPKGFAGRLTVFKHVSVVTGPSPGPVTVALSITAEARIAGIANSLPAMAPVMCHENELLYVLAFHPKRRRTPLYQLQGWGCAGQVQVTVDGTALPPLEDRSCSLLQAVAVLAPRSASGTRGVAGLCSRKG